MTLRAARRPSTAAVLAAVALCLAFAAEAGATCVTAPAKTGLALPATHFAPRAAAQGSADHEGGDARAWLVGMWLTEFRVGDALYDQTFQQFHSDGTENMLSNGLPPSLGNVCLGVWAQVGPRTIKLRHVAWNFDADGRFAGLFQMVVTLAVDRSGTSYTGAFVADSYDLSSQIIPDLHVAGTVRATRITVD